jgi:hypothetical protein
LTVEVKKTRHQLLKFYKRWAGLSRGNTTSPPVLQERTTPGVVTRQNAGVKMIFINKVKKFDFSIVKTEKAEFLFWKITCKGWLL